MFTDMVGYTALGQRNESLSLALVEEQRKLIRLILGRHEGREVKTMGDAFLVEFQNALEAVRCAFDIQKATREFNITVPEQNRIYLRVGVHLGDVVESQGDIAGDAVNIASRIESFAKDGGVCITRPVWEQVENKFALPLISLGEKSLKNVQRPVEVFRVEMPWEGKVEPTGLDKLRLAVLPFASLSPDPNDEYFADGMTEELITTLSQIRQLRVIARTSAMRYKGEKKSAAEIGRELEVGSLVEGSVRKAGNRLRITVQLLESQTQEHLWSANYDKELQDVFAVQSEIAKRVADTLQVELLGRDDRSLEGRPSESLPAYLAYLKGRVMLDRRSKEGWIEARRLFESSIEQDPNYAPAYAGLAEAWYTLGWAEIVPGQLAREKGGEYALKAISLDDNLPEAHVSLGLKLREEYLWVEAESELRRAIELRPNYAWAHVTYSRLLLRMGRFREAQTQVALAEKADPVSSEVLLTAIWLHCALRQFDAALIKLEKATSLDPNNPNLFPHWSFYNYRLGDNARAIEWLEKKFASKDDTHSRYLSGALASLYVNVGRRDKAIDIRNKLLALPENTVGRANGVAFISGYLGDADECFKWATRAVEEKTLYTPDFMIDPELQYIRDNPRWIELLKKANLNG